MSRSRSEPALWMQCGELDLPGLRLASGLSASSRDSSSSEFSGVRSSWLMLARNSDLVLAGGRQLLGLLLDAAPGGVDLHVLDLDVAVLLGELRGLLLQLGVGVLQLGRSGLQLPREVLGLREQLLGAPVGLDGADRDADGHDEALEEGQVQLAEAGHGAELDDAQRAALERDGQHDGTRAAEPTPERIGR